MRILVGVARSMLDVVLGRRLASAEEARERIGPAEGVAVLGLDALSSTGYGPEAALTVLLPLGAAGVGWLWPISLAVVAVLLALFLSYRQTIDAYPGGGGSYTVARENLGTGAGLLAASALLLDYLLNVAVGTSAGVGALASVFPALEAHRLPAALALLAIIALLNLRGLREAGLAFLAPTYAFLGSALVVLAAGAIRGALAGGAPRPLAPPAPLHAAVGVATPWLLLRAFAAGCTAMTGVEAVSNAVPAFRPPGAAGARRTLAVIVAGLAVLLLGIGAECRMFGVGATPPTGPGYQSVLSQLAGAAVGRGVLYAVFMAATFAVLALSVNTSFAGFPRLCALLARDGFLPGRFRHQGRRLSFTAGLVVLWGAGAALLALFDGVTDRLIPLFAVGAFTAFTFSQAGMVVRWARRRGAAWRRAAAVNAFGAAATGASLAVIVAAKLLEGAWISVAAIPAVALGLRALARRHAAARRASALERPLSFDGLAPPLILVALLALDRAAEKALRLALSLAGAAGEVRVVHVTSAETEPDEVRRRFAAWVAEPARQAGLPPPRLDIVGSPYRERIHPLVEHVRRVEAEGHRAVAVVIPEVVHASPVERWLDDGGAVLVAELLVRACGDRVSVIRVPWASPA